jgi:TolA-binding protein
MHYKNLSLISLFIAGFFLFGCSNKQENLKNEISTVEQQIFNDTTGEVVTQKAEKTIELYNQYIQNYPHDSLSAEYLYRAAQLSTAIGKYEEAIVFYDKLMSSFPQVSKAAEALFMKAFVYDNYLHRYDKAREYYTQFIQKYPNHDLRQDAEKSIQFLGKSNAEIIQLLQSNSNNAQEGKTQN